MSRKIAVPQNALNPGFTALQVLDLAAAVLRSLRLYQSRRRTSRFLQGLDDAGLKDIGLQRGMVDAAFHDVRYSPRL